MRYRPGFTDKARIEPGLGLISIQTLIFFLRCLRKNVITSVKINGTCIFYSQCKLLLVKTDMRSHMHFSLGLNLSLVCETGN